MNNLFKESKQFLRQFDDNFQIERTKFYQAKHDAGYTEWSNEDQIDDYLWRSPNNGYYILGAEWEYLQIVTKEMAELNDQGVYFHLCKFSTYEKTFNDRLNEFLEIYEDAEPIFFLTKELRRYLKPVTFKKEFERLDQENQIKLGYTRHKVIRFLTEQALKINYKITIVEDDLEDTTSYDIEEIEDNLHQKHPQIQWHGNQTEFIELIKALIENGTLKGTQKEIIQKTSDFFNIEIKNPDKLLQDIKKRNTVSATLFIDSLKSNLYDYITKEIIR